MTTGVNDPISDENENLPAEIAAQIRAGFHLAYEAIPAVEEVQPEQSLENKVGTDDQI